MLMAVLRRFQFWRFPMPHIYAARIPTNNENKENRNREEILSTGTRGGGRDGMRVSHGWFGRRYLQDGVNNHRDMAVVRKFGLYAKS